MASASASSARVCFRRDFRVARRTRRTCARSNRCPSQCSQKLIASLVWPHHCLITIYHAATIGPCGPRPPPPGAAGGGAPPAGGAGTGPRSGWKRYALCVTGSTAIVFAPANVATVATTVYLSGASWWTTVTLPSPPFGMYISFFDGSHPKASTRVPFVMDATTLPVLASTTTDVLLQPEKMRFDALSYAIPVGPSHGASGQDAVAFHVLASITWMVFFPSLFTKMCPL